MYKIRKATLESIIMAAANTYPNEFVSLLGGDKEKKLVDEFILVPAIYGKKFTLIKSHLIPFDSRILGTVHSHPSPNAFPSKADLNTFGRLGRIHLIISLPFNLNTVKAYNSKGEEQDFEITD